MGDVRGPARAGGGPVEAGRRLAATLEPGDLTPEGIARLLAGPACDAARLAAPEIRGRAGAVAWAAAWPAWRVLTTRHVMAILIRIAVELLLAAFAFPHARLIRSVLALLRAVLAGPAVAATWVAATAAPYPPGESLGAALDALLARVAEYRADPMTRPMLVAAERLLAPEPVRADFFTWPVREALSDDA
jgi:hypothetical protein